MAYIVTKSIENIRNNSNVSNFLNVKLVEHEGYVNVSEELSNLEGRLKE